MTTEGRNEAESLITPEELDDMEALSRKFSMADRWERFCGEVRRLRVDRDELRSRIRELTARAACPRSGLMGPLEHHAKGCCS